MRLLLKRKVARHNSNLLKKVVRENRRVREAGNQRMKLKRQKELLYLPLDRLLIILPKDRLGHLARTPSSNIMALPLMLMQQPLQLPKCSGTTILRPTITTILRCIIHICMVHFAVMATCHNLILAF